MLLDTISPATQTSFTLSPSRDFASLSCESRAKQTASRLEPWFSHNFLIASDSLNLTLLTPPYTPPLHNKLFSSHPCPWEARQGLSTVHVSRAGMFRKQDRAKQASLDKREANRRIPATTGFSFARADPRAALGPTALDGCCRPDSSTICPDGPWVDRLSSRRPGPDPFPFSCTCTCACKSLPAAALHPTAPGADHA